MMDDRETALFRRVVAERDAYRLAFKRAFTAYLIWGHGLTEAQAVAEAERVMAETERRIAQGEVIG